MKKYTIMIFHKYKDTFSATWDVFIAKILHRKKNQELRNLNIPITSLTSFQVMPGTPRAPPSPVRV